MRYVLSFGLPVVLLGLGFWFLLHQYRSFFRSWYKEVTWHKVLIYSGEIVAKALISLLLIVLIHNNFHEQHLIELTLFLALFFGFSILQSSFSINGFFSRIRYIYRYAKMFFLKRSEDANEFRDKLTEAASGSYSFVIKAAVVIAFLVLFLPNITVFVAANIFYFLFLLGLILLATLLNNIVYFGISALIAFQYDPGSITFGDFNPLVMTLTFVILLVGFVVETRLDNRMFFIKTVMNVKSFKFHLGYQEIYRSGSIIIYRNLVNGYYYFYYRITGLVIVYDSYADLSISGAITRKMIRKGTQYLKETNEI